MISSDTLLFGKVRIAQPTKTAGYRVNVDAVHLAHFAAKTFSRCAYDLGSGVGAVSLLLLHERAVETVVLVEREPALAELAKHNLHANGWADRGVVLCQDALRLAPETAHAADLVVCNPPYFEPGTGQHPNQAQVARARTGPLEPFIAAAGQLLARRGRTCFVYPARDLARILSALRGAGLEPKRLRLVHGRGDRDARIALVEAKRGRQGGLVVEPPLIEND